MPFGKNGNDFPGKYSRLHDCGFLTLIEFHVLNGIQKIHGGFGPSQNMIVTLKNSLC
jgi:hypothetical protein